MNHGILFDHSRTARIGLPEAIFCEGKPFEAIVELLSQFGKAKGTLSCLRALCRMFSRKRRMRFVMVLTIILYPVRLSETRCRQRLKAGSL
jgi:NCAIR mutase (PurE)-related protein